MTLLVLPLFTTLQIKIDYFSDSNTVYNKYKWVIKRNVIKIEWRKQDQTANATSGLSLYIEIVPLLELEVGPARKVIHLYYQNQI